MCESPTKPMLGGCCICLDERGWAENPLVYCDGKECSIAVHQACYGIESVPSGPWFCRRCEVHGAAIQLSCVLCPFQGGAMKKVDDEDKWAHIVCALYIPEVEFKSVSSMEPIIIEKIPEERFKKICYVCEKEERGEKSIGSCMDCNKTGCKLSFHVTCAQMTGLLCEEAGASNTTKYCGYCFNHSKQKKSNPHKNLACAKVYKLPSPVDEIEKKESIDNTMNPVVKCEMLSPKKAEELISGNDKKVNEVKVKEENIVEKNKDVDQEKTDNSTVVPSDSLISLADAAATALEMTNLEAAKESEAKSTDIITSKNTQIEKTEHKKKVKRKSNKVSDKDGSSSAKKVSKPKKLKTTTTQIDKSPKPKSVPMAPQFLDTGYATAPKHSVISLAEFGDSSLEPSHPSDIGKTKPTPNTCCSNVDGLTTIKEMVEQQQNELMSFFQEIGTPSDVAQLLQSLKKLQDENSQMDSAIEKMTHRRDQLVAIKARLSVPLQSTSFSRVNSNTSNSTVLDSKQFAVPLDQQAIISYPYGVNKN